jgi:hypothetical protein
MFGDNVSVHDHAARMTRFSDEKRNPQLREMLTATHHVQTIGLYVIQRSDSQRDIPKHAFVHM